MMDADEYADLFQTTIRAADLGRERTQQSEQGIIGVSDLGSCKEKVRRTIIGETPSNVTSNTSAIIGTYIHEGALKARQDMLPDLLIEQEVKVELPNGAVVLGHADEIDPNEPSVTDAKTVDGIQHVSRHGSTLAQRWQRHLYYAGAAQAGLVPEEGLTRNIWLDRSGKTDRVWVEQEPFNPAYVDDASSWLDDVLYAVTNGEEASKDQPIPWCLAFCPFAGQCRADTYPREVITDPHVIETAQEYELVKARAKADELYLEQAKDVLRGHEGVAGDVNIRWIQVNAANPYLRLEVRKAS